MRQLLITVTIAAMTNFTNAIAQDLDFAKVKSIEHQLDDVMEFIDTTEVKVKLEKVEELYNSDHNEINKARLGIIYHEVALNLSFFKKSEYKGYAKKSYDVLTDLVISPGTTPELMPFVTAYRASALSLVSAETRNLKLLTAAFKEFESSVEKYGMVSYCPEFLRGSVAENLPWFLFSKRKFAKIDFKSIIEKQEKNKNYANDKVMSFTYWAWAEQHQSRKYRKQAMDYLEKSIELDLNNKAGETRAEELRKKLQLE